MKYKTGEFNMNTKLLLSVCLISLFGLVGCANLNRNQIPACTGADCPQTAIIEQEVSVKQDNQNNYICQNVADPDWCPKDPFVNYSQTAADFREYGEKNPRDRMISQAAAGNNLSASIPPSIEDEVVEYEEKAGISDNSEGETIVKETETVTITENEENTFNEENDDENDAENLEDPVQDWLAEEGQNLKALLTEWSDQSGWRLVWNTNRNYVLSAGAMFRGRFADVSSALIRAFARARPAPIATFYKGNRVLVVETMEDENAYE